MISNQEKTYEMLWDCEYCGTKKLLGKSQRHCPNCGAAQNPNKRYFPAENEKVAVQDHPYVGADVQCPSCKGANSKAAIHCTECGSPLKGAESVKLIEDGSVSASSEPQAKKVPAGPARKPSKKRKTLIVLGIALAAAIAFFAAALWQKDIAITVTAHTWRREIGIENFAPRQKDAWCDQMPKDAYSVSRAREVRSHRKVADGETCGTKRVDRGDGTYSERKECKTKYRSEPVYDDKCRFTVDRWERVRSVTAEGRSLEETPYWPTVNLAGTGAGVGAEREGQRSAYYKVHFKTPKGAEETCDFSEEQWRSLKVGAVVVAKMGVVTGILDCSTIVGPARSSTK